MDKHYTEYPYDVQAGLNNKQINELQNKGLVNNQTLQKTKSYKKIISDNLLTIFNLINIVLAALIIFIGSFKNLLFLGVVLSNLVIGIFQEIRSKRILDKLSLLSSNKTNTIRNNEIVAVTHEEILLHDIVKLKTGDQVCCDSIVRSGYVEVNESLINGEPDIIRKETGDYLFSGCFIVAGNANVSVEHINEDNYANKIMSDAKTLKKHKSQLRDSINFIIKTISIIIIPLGIMLFIKQYLLLGCSLDDTIIATVAAILGMIPEGLVLLTSVALAIGSINLAKKNTLVQELFCIETLARVDVLCLDKTGTITQGKMELENIITINNSYNVNEIINNLSASLDDDNATMQAIKKHSIPALSYQLDKVIPFSSARKLSAVSYKGLGTYVLGAYEFITNNYDSKILKTIEEYANMGKRVLVLAHSNSSIVNDSYKDEIEVIALLLLMDPLRPEAKDTLEYFLKQGVRIKIISGDHPATVNEIARMAGLKYNGKYIDASKLNDEEIIKAAIEFDVFGRVTPAQKKLMIVALKDNGHIVAMTGDGVNDVLALKEADCSIAIASGAEAAKNVANLVLLDSNFASMPHIVDEGRRVINNIQRSSSLFLVKTTFSTMLAIITLFLSTKYPFEPIQLTLISTISIGVPGFFLALEANTSRVEGNFLVNVFSKALPGAIMVIICVGFANLTSELFSFSEIARSTICVILTGSSGLLVLRRVCLPFTKKRVILFTTMCTIFFTAIIFAKDIFVLTTLSHFQLLLTIAAICCIPPLLDIIAKLLHLISIKFKINKTLTK